MIVLQGTQVKDVLAHYQAAIARDGSTLPLEIAVRSRKNKRTSLVYNKATWEFQDSVESRGEYLELEHDEADQNSEYTETSQSSDEGSRRVRFAAAQEGYNGVKVEVLALLTPASEMTAREKRTLWWQKSDYHEFRKNIKMGLSDLDQSCETVSGSYSSTITKVYEACCSANDSSCDIKDVLSYRERMEFVAWTRVALSRRGLEYQTIPVLAEARKQNRKKLVGSVIELQRREGGSFDTKSKCNSISRFLQKRTQSSQLFARLLAETDAVALVPSQDDPILCRRRFSL